MHATRQQMDYALDDLIWKPVMVFPGGEFSNLLKCVAPREFFPYRGILNPIEEDTGRIKLDPWLTNMSYFEITKRLVVEFKGRFREELRGKSGAVIAYESSEDSLEIPFADIMSIEYYDMEEY